MAEVVLRRVDEAELIRAEAELRRMDPELVRALAEVRIEEIRSAESMGGVFVQLLALTADKLRTDSPWIGEGARTRRVEKAYALAAQATLAIWTSQGALGGSSDFALLLREAGGRRGVVSEMLPLQEIGEVRRSA